MFKLSLLLLSVLLFTACNSKPKNRLDGEKLIQAKCSKCHNLDLPPKTFEDEKAPPMMAVSFHIMGFIKASDPSMKRPKAIAFVKDYVLYPSAEKSFCDKESLKEYGVMPSQKGKVTKEELDAIAPYIFSYFTQKNLDTAQRELNAFHKLPKGEQIARKNNCLSCHRVDRDIVGPSFEKITEKYSKEPQHIIKAIREGSRNKWASSKGAMMPTFKNISPEDLKVLSKWILEQKQVSGHK